MCWHSHFSIGIAASVWTVIQTSFHIIWAICGYYFYVCKIRPNYYGLVILYLTYFYKGECGNVTLKCDGLLESENRKKIGLSSVEEEENIYDIIQTILDKGVLPEESNAAYRTHIYFHAFIISDAVWIISAFLLFAGTCFQIKKCLSLLFYCPWLIVTCFVILLDVISSVHFGLDILTIHNFTSWLNFIGVQNYQDFSEYNKHSSSYIVPLLPALLLCTLFSRGLVFWVGNIILFVQVLNNAVLAFQDNLDGNNPKHQSKIGRAKGLGKNQNLDTSASRIRNWQLFYGAVDTTSSSSSSKSSERDFNSNNTMRRTSTKVKIKEGKTFPSPPQTPDSSDSYEKYVRSIRDESQRMKPNASTYYHAYTDVAESLDQILGRRTEPDGSHKNQLSWSYFKPPDERCDIEYSLNDPGDFNRCGIPVKPTATSKPFISTEL
ncbi:uncharacterized protein LOC108908216 [Anoplophora glabripennis]|uniref:uncharacterized protein LOC108908216 n=1 Tax=Anoplophora glabripennis TaxID=217634 RepID=UPI000873C53C|nr:uncharacterized protein LOC108908216 [Anoplophora glabripennis]